MHNGISLAELSRRQVAVFPHEAVAIAQKLINGACGGHDARAPYGPPSIDSVVISVDGDVLCRGTAATPSVTEVAIFLQSMLEGRRLPGALRYTLGRALLDVDAPPFDSVHDLSAALERFEDGDRDAAVAGLARRAVDRTVLARHDGGRTGDRRRQGPGVATLRQELRLADLQLYQARQHARAARGDSGAPHAQRGGRRRAALSAPVAACMLAGVALVMAGEVTERRATPPIESAATDGAWVSASVPSAGAVRATDIALPPAVHEGTSPTPRAGIPSRPLVRRAKAPRPAQRQRVAPPPARRAAEDHDAFLARIRFEWDNPLKRGH
jgi:hypothetical protein